MKTKPIKRIDYDSPFFYTPHAFIERLVNLEGDVLWARGRIANVDYALPHYELTPFKLKVASAYAFAKEFYKQFMP